MFAQCVRVQGVVVRGMCVCKEVTRAAQGSAVVLGRGQGRRLRRALGALRPSAPVSRPAWGRWQPRPRHCRPRGKVPSPRPGPGRAPPLTPAARSPGVWSGVWSAPSPRPSAWLCGMPRSGRGPSPTSGVSALLCGWRARRPDCRGGDGAGLPVPSPCDRPRHTAAPHFRAAARLSGSADTGGPRGHGGRPCMCSLGESIGHAASRVSARSPHRPPSGTRIPGASRSTGNLLVVCTWGRR